MDKQTKSDRLNRLYTEYNLTREDVFTSPQGWNIITRTGIDAIQAGAGINISYDPIVVERKFVVVKATGTLNETTIETFGEADCDTNCRQNYPVAMAEKRAMARAVLKLTGFYELGVFSEEEADDFKKEAVLYRKTL